MVHEIFLCNFVSQMYDHPTVSAVVFYKMSGCLGMYQQSVAHNLKVSYCFDEASNFCFSPSTKSAYAIFIPFVDINSCMGSA